MYPAERIRRNNKNPRNRRMSVSRPGLAVCEAQVVAQDYGGGDVVECRLSLSSRRLLAAATRWRGRIVRLNSLLRFPGAQPLIYHLNGNAQCFFDARGKALRFFGHIARCAIQVQRQSDDDAAYHMLPHQIAQTRKIPASIDARPNRKWAGAQALFVRKSESQALLSIIDGQNYTRAGIIANTRRSTER